MTLGRKATDQPNRMAHGSHRRGHPGFEPAPLRNWRARLLRRITVSIGHGSRHRQRNHRHQHFSRIIQVLLAIYSVAVFATLAGTLGAYFLREKE